MESLKDYEVIFQRKLDQSYSQRYAVVGINYEKPTYVKAIVRTDLKRGERFSVDQDDSVIYEGRKIGSVVDFKDGDEIKVNTDYDIKYTGGYSVDGKTVFLDEHFPRFIEVDGKKIDTTVSIDRHHEIPEKWLSDNAFEYPYAHEIATKIEREYVESLGVNWDDYCREVDRQLREVYRRKLQKSPKDLDLAPYFYSRDKEALKEIRDSEK